jgi:large subunit ribosomal protein L25
MATYEFTAKVRSIGGKSGVKQLRGQDVLPAVVYGRGEAGLKVEVSAKEVPLLYLRTLGKNSLLTMKLTDEKGATKEETVMFKEVQREPVKNRFLHVDFYHVDPKHPIKLKVPVVLEGVPVGVKEEGGILQHPTRTVTVKCLPSDIPADIKVDVSNLKTEQSILLRDFKAPKGVTFLSAPLTVLAQVAAVVEEKAPEPAADAAAAAAGPEVITAKKPEEGKAGDAKAGDAKAAPAAGKDAKAAPAAKAPAKK